MNWSEKLFPRTKHTLPGGMVMKDVWPSVLIHLPLNDTLRFREVSKGYKNSIDNNKELWLHHSQGEATTFQEYKDKVVPRLKLVQKENQERMKYNHITSIMVTRNPDTPLSIILNRVEECIQNINPRYTIDEIESTGYFHRREVYELVEDVIYLKGSYDLSEKVVQEMNGIFIRHERIRVCIY